MHPLDLLKVIEEDDACDFKKEKKPASESGTLHTISISSELQTEGSEASGSGGRSVECGICKKKVCLCNPLEV